MVNGIGNSNKNDLNVNGKRDNKLSNSNGTVNIDSIDISV